MRQAAAVVERLRAAAEPLGVAVSELENGATVVDAGVEVDGTLEAGRLFAEVCLGGLADVQFRAAHLEASSSRASR